MLSKPPGSSSDHSLGNDVLTLSAIYAFAQKHWRLLAAFILAPTSLAILYCALATPIYTAHAQLLLDPQTPQPMQQQHDTNSTYDNPQIESEIALLKSDTIAASVAQTLGLVDDPEYSGDAAPPADDVAKALQLQKVITAITDALDVRRSGLSYAIDVSVSARDPVKAAKIANAISDAYIQDQLAARARAVRAGSEWLEERIDALRRQMNASALKVQQFKVKRDYRIQSDVPVAQDRQTPPEKVIPSEEGLTLEELESTASTYRRIYESYLQAYTESLQRQSFPIANARIITPAVRPLKKSSPKTLLIIAFASLLGLLAGFGIALMREQWAQKPELPA